MQNIITHRISTDTFFRFFLIVISLVIAWNIREILIAILVGIMIASSVTPVVNFFSKFKIPKAVTALTVLLSLMTLFIGTFALFIPIIYSEIANFFANLADFQTRIVQSISAFTGDPNFLSNTFGTLNPNDITLGLKSVVSGVSGGISTTAGLIATFVFQIVIIFVIAFYLSVTDRGVEKFLRIITPIRHEDYIISLWQRSQAKIVSWMKGQAILAALIGLIVYIGLTFLGVEHAFLFALLAAVCETIPIVGMTLAMIPAVLVAFVTGGTPMFVTTLIFYFIVGQIENHILSPLVVNKVVGIPSLVVIISLLVGGALLGFWGVLIAVPLAATLMELVEDVEKNKVKLKKLLKEQGVIQ